MAIDRTDPAVLERLAKRETIVGPIHPGEILKEEFLDPMGMSQAHLAEKAGIAAMRISEIIRGRRGITADTALGLAEAFGTSPEFWLQLQMRYDLDRARLNRAKGGKPRKAREFISAEPHR